MSLCRADRRRRGVGWDDHAGSVPAVRTMRSKDPYGLSSFTIQLSLYATSPPAVVSPSPCNVGPGSGNVTLPIPRGARDDIGHLQRTIGARQGERMSRYGYCVGVPRPRTERPGVDSTGGGSKG